MADHEKYFNSILAQSESTLMNHIREGSNPM